MTWKCPKPHKWDNTKFCPPNTQCWWKFLFAMVSFDSLTFVLLKRKNGGEKLKLILSHYCGAHHALCSSLCFCVMVSFLDSQLLVLLGYLSYWGVKVGKRDKTIQLWRNCLCFQDVFWRNCLRKVPSWVLWTGAEPYVEKKTICWNYHQRISFPKKQSQNIRTIGLLLQKLWWWYERTLSKKFKQFC